MMDHVTAVVAIIGFFAAGFVIGFFVVPRIIRRARQRRLRELSRRIADLAAHMAREKEELREMIDLLM